MKTAEACIAHLTSVLALETDALARMDTEAAAALYPEKKRLVDMVEAFAAAGALRTLPDARSIAAQLAEVGGRNRQALEQAMKTQGVVIKLMVDAARQSRPSTSYGRTGNAATGWSRQALAVTAKA